MTALKDRFVALVAEQAPLSVEVAATAFDRVAAATRPSSEAAIESLRAPLATALRAALSRPAVSTPVETTPGVALAERLAAGVETLVALCDGFLRREALTAGLTADERREMLRGMVLTRAVDNRLKTLFTNSEVRHGATPFQGKGFRSLGQEAIYACALRLHRGPAYRAADGSWTGDVMGPITRDLGAALARRPDGAMVRMVLSAQMGKAGPPREGRDLHIGDFGWGVVPAAAPLAISSLTVAGLGLAFAQNRARPASRSRSLARAMLLARQNGTEAIGNLCAARKLPVVFCVQNNQTALATPVADQSAVRVFADKAVGYGVPGLTVDGTDPEAIAAAFAWAGERARAGEGPTLLELVAMRMCGHAHPDDMHVSR